MQISKIYKRHQVTNGDGKLSKMFNCLIIFLLYLNRMTLAIQSYTSPEMDGCDPLVYRVLDDHRRSVLYTTTTVQDIDSTTSLSDDLLCDDVLPFGWYRFLAYGMSREMATSCPNPGSCGTQAPVWLDPASYNETYLHSKVGVSVVAESCVSWSFASDDNDAIYDSPHDCCLFTLPVVIKNCGAFHVYHLGPTQACSIAYCTSPTSSTSQIGTHQILRPTVQDLDVYMPVKRSVPVVRLEFISSSSSKASYALKCNHDCLECSMNWYKISKKDGQKSRIFWNENLLPISSQKFQIGDKILCDITSSRSGRTLFSEVSDVFETGVVVEGDNLSQLSKNGFVYSIILKQKIPMSCQYDLQEDECHLKVNFIITPETMSAKHSRRRKILLSSCSVQFENPQRCGQTVDGGFCNFAVVNLTVPEDYSSNFETDLGQIILNIVSSGDMAWTGIEPITLDYSISNAPTSQCHVFTEPHIITFDQHRFDFYGTGTFLLHKNDKDDFEIHIRFWDCDPESGRLSFISCACGLVARDASDVVKVDLCRRQMAGKKRRTKNVSSKSTVPDLEAFSLLKNGTIHAQISTARDGNVIFIDFSSQRFLRIDIETWGMSVTLQAIGSDFENSIGLCGNFDGNPSNDFNRPNESIVNSGITFQQINEFMERWRYLPTESLFDETPEGPFQERYPPTCECGEDFDNSAKCSNGIRNRKKLLHTIDITRKVTEMGKNEISSYLFAGDMMVEHEQDVEGVLEYPTMSGLTEEEVFRLCTDVLVNSTIAKTCGRFFDRDIMHAIDMCVVDVTLMDDPTWATFSLPLIETQCEAAIWRQKTKWQKMNPDNPPKEISESLNCPNNCSGRGTCNGRKCLCNLGFSGPSCNEGSLETTTQKAAITSTKSVNIKFANSQCDIRTSDNNCTNADVYGELITLDEDSVGVCEIENLSTKQFHRSPYIYVSSNHIRCTIPPQWIEMSDFHAAEMSLKINIIPNLTLIKNLIMVHHVIFDSECHLCQEKMNSNSLQGCQRKLGVCQYKRRCFKDGSKKPDDKCLICKNGNWINELKQTKPTVNSALNLKFTMMVGDSFAYRLPGVNPDTKFELISGPYGATLDSEKGLLRWKAMSNLIVDKWTEVFMIEASGGCGEQTQLEINLDVLRCHCQNDGHCRTDLLNENGSPACLCTRGFTGKNCEVSDICSSDKCVNGSCVPSENDFICLCNPGYTGKLCDVEIIDGCKTKPCYPGVSCFSDPFGNFQCGLCPKGFTGNGLTCSPSVNPCASNPCYPDVDCNLMSNGSYKCGPCPVGFTGDGINCDEKNACNTKNPCFKDVECFPLGEDEFVCGLCPTGLTGDGLTCVPLEDKVGTDLCVYDKKNSCFEKSLCRRTSGGNITCVACPQGFKGDGIKCKPVENMKDLCQEKNPCYPGSSCDVVNGIVTCGPCPIGTIGDGKECQQQQLSSTKKQKIDFCQSNPCFPGAECYSLTDRFKCGSCPSGYTGNGVKCTPAHNPCSPNPCHIGVACMTVWKGRQALFACGLCPDGMVGDGMKCTRTDPCESSPCFPGTVCIPMHDKGTYECGPCPHGLIGTGKTCRPPFHPCESSPCYPGVSCTENGEDFQCGPCPIGTIGDGIMCKDIDDCRNDLCFPGVKCEDLKAPLRGYKCGPCPTGFTGNGKHCVQDERSPIQCPSSNPCYPGVQCYRNNISVFSQPPITCGTCPEGYSGDGVRCKPKCVPKCFSSSQFCSAPNVCTTRCDPPCENGGRCSKSGRCKCPNGYKGKYCTDQNSLDLPRDDKMISGWNNNSHSSKLCSNESCLNGGTCLPSGVCSCKSGTKGNFCQEITETYDSLMEPSLGFLLTKSMGESLMELALVPRCKRRCQNGGTCISGRNKCRCKKGFKGRFCQKPKCIGGCKNGGKCVAPDTCVCQKGFTGKNCKSAVCSPACQNGGRCFRPGRCKCKSMFFGNYCQHPNLRRSAKNYF